MSKALLVWLAASLLLLTSPTESLPDYEPPYGEKLNPKPFQYEYGLQSPSGAAFSKKEAQDEEGNVVGEVIVALPDGRVQTTNYNADFYEGYNADIKYAGTASFPDEHQHQTYNAPKFIPVHLKSRPRIPNIQINRYKTHSPPTHSEKSNSQYKRKPVLQPELKSIDNIDIYNVESTQPSKTSFESEKIESVESPGGLKIKEVARTRLEKLSISSEGELTSIAEKRAEVRDNLKNINKVKESEKLRLDTKQPEQHRFQNRPLTTRNPDKLVRIPKKDKKDSNNIDNNRSRLPSLNPKTPPLMVIKSHIMSEPKDKRNEIMKPTENDISKSERIREGAVKPKEQTFKNTPLSSRKPEKIRNINKIGNDAKRVRVPSLNPETPPLMIIKSHLMSEAKHNKFKKNRVKDSKEGPELMKIKSNVKKAMSIKSHVKSAPRPAESMEIIMKKIKEDQKKKEKTNQVTLPSPVLRLESNKDSQKTEKLIFESRDPSLISRIPTIQETPEIKKVILHVMEKPEDPSAAEPLRNSVAEFMKKVELMKKIQKTPIESTMFVQSRVIDLSDTDNEKKVPKMLLSRDISKSLSLGADIPSNEDSSNPVRY